MRDFLCNGGQLDHLKDALTFSSFLLCLNRNKVLITCDLLPKISLVVDQSSVNISTLITDFTQPFS